MPYRRDVTTISISADKRTPQGGLAVPANLSRTGVQVYRRADGTEIREYRPESEVFNADALASFAGAPVTIGHPGEVNPSNFKTHAVGHVSDVVSRKGRFMHSTVRVQDAQAIAAIESGKLLELSCGYQVDLDPTPGVAPDGQKYDAVQRNIRGNHVALCPPGGGRAGSEVKLHLDQAEGDEVVSRFDSVDSDVDPKTDQSEKPAAAPLAPIPSVAKADHDKVVGENEALRAENEALKAKLAKNDEVISARVLERSTLCDSARAILKDFVFDGKSDHDIRKAAVSVVYPDMKLDGKSEDHVAGVFETALASAKDAVKSREILADATDPAKKHDAAPPTKTHAQKLADEMANAWKTPAAKA